MSSEEPKVRGIVSEVGLERDEGHFRSFNLKIGVLVKGERRLGYEQGERLMRQFRKELLGKEVDVTPIMVRCPICGRGFNSERGMKQHVRMNHEKKKAKKTRKTRRKKKV
ncbi:MAG: C2H2-type zinc finger protein [Candidatus Bathyarchaeota archaeon]|nr:C2H2-type zinc finger protein [Candidatus Bathyarchaeota archaeon]